MIDIIYKCLESRVAGVDDITLEKITVLSAMMNNCGCDGVRHVFNYLGTFILKAIKPGSQVIFVNVGYGFMIATLLKKEGNLVGGWKKNSPKHLPLPSCH